MPNWYALEGFVIVNLLLFMVLFSFVCQSIAKALSDILVVLIQKYFESKKQFLIDVSRLDVPGSGALRGSQFS